MTRLVGWIVFISISLAVVGGAHYYLWLRLVRDVALPPPLHYALTAVTVLLFVSVPLTFWVDGALPPERARRFVLLGYVWLGLAFFLLVLVAGADLGRGVARLIAAYWSDGPPSDPGKRLTMSRMVGGSVALLAGGAGALAVRSGLGPVDVKEVRVALSRLPERLSGTVIAQISDLHIGATLGRDFAEDIVERVNAIEPDVIVITGDLVDGSVHVLRDHVAPLANLRAPHGVYFVTGNHEYYSGAGSWCKEVERLGIRVLRNERVEIGDDEASFDLAGVDDYGAARIKKGHGQDVQKALAGRDESREVVLLAHQPRTVFEAKKFGVGLQLSGHTHGGQMWPWNFLVRLQQPVVSGLARFGDTLVYVSNGTGFWGPPMRLGAPAEITKVVLEAPAVS